MKRRIYHPNIKRKNIHCPGNNITEAKIWIIYFNLQFVLFSLIVDVLNLKPFLLSHFFHNISRPIIRTCQEITNIGGDTRSSFIGTVMLMFGREVMRSPFIFVTRKEILGSVMEISLLRILRSMGILETIRSDIK